MATEGIKIAKVRAILLRPLALLCLIDGEKVWIPRSQICKGSKVRKAGDEGTLVVTEWLAEIRHLWL